MFVDPNMAMLMGIALCNVVIAFISYRTHALTKQVEVATNSMKDALVKSTGEAAHAAGRVEGVREERANPQIHATKEGEAYPVKIIPDKAIPVIVEKNGK